jgi:hypothetical protein
VLINDAAVPPSDVRFLVGFHGYAQNAEEMLTELDRLPNCDAWTRVSVQALHRFYLRGDEKIVASWMTRQDRELAIADNVDYVDRVVRSLLADAPQAPVVFVGFSQGVRWHTAPASWAPAPLEVSLPSAVTSHPM